MYVTVSHTNLYAMLAIEVSNNGRTGDRKLTL